MALIKCTECGKEISDSAKMCPHCGNETEHAKTIANAKLVATRHLVQTITAFIIEIIGVILFLSGQSALSEDGISFFSMEWLESNYSSTRAAGIRALIGFTLMVTCILVVIIARKFAACEINEIACSNDTYREHTISGKCDLCDTQGPTAFCRIPDLAGEYELCRTCMDEYAAEPIGAQKKKNS